MIKKHKIFIAAITALICSSIMGEVISGSVSAISNITYQTSIDPTFTINPSLNVSLSSPDLVISDLVPGQSSDSNIITINVESNNQTGYVLNSSVGNSTAYNTDALVNSNDYNATFTNMTTTGSLSAGEWGYSYATYDISNSTWSSWSNYAGLPLYNSTAKTLATSPTNGTTTVQFKIGAYADTDQPSGEYNNIVNFTVVGNAIPTTMYQAFYAASQNDPTITQKNGYYKMQDMSPAICSAVTEIPSEMQLIDVRDDNVYRVAKLTDNRCWMTTNLDLAGGTQLTSDDTDMPSTWTLPTTSGFQSSNTLPTSSSIKPTSATTMAYLYNSNSATCGENSPCYSYYSWTAATLGSGLDISTANTDAPYSVCPKNWHLPNTRTGTNNAADFRVFMISLGGTASISNYTTSTNPTGTTLYNKIIASPYNFALSGAKFSDIDFKYGSSRGLYWSSTSHSDGTRAYNLYFSSTFVYSADDSNRSHGFAVRCVAND